jgi:uncharacterized membrane protein SpoIIM required for sporulation
MILDLQRFIEKERPDWKELERMLTAAEGDMASQMTLVQVQRFHHLYRKASSDLVKLSSFSSEQEVRQYLETLVTRAYGEIHEIREKPHQFAPHRWFLESFPQAFRRHIKAFYFSLAVTFLGALFGSFAFLLDPESKEVLMPFQHLHGDPAERVRQEESSQVDRLEGAKGTFSSQLMTHNTKVSIVTFGLGITWGFGTFIMLFYNGVILGVVVLDYVLAGQTPFLIGWLLPHGSVEIPAILIAGQAGFVLASALIGWRKPLPLAARLRAVSLDLTYLIFGVAVMLVWAGFIESFLSQYHQPVIPYSIKIAFGSVELVLLFFFLLKAGTSKPSGAVES